LFDYLTFSNSFIERIEGLEVSKMIKKRLDKDRIKNLEKAIIRAIKKRSKYISDMVTSQF